MLLKIIRPKLSLVEIKAQFSAPCWIGRDLYLSNRGVGDAENHQEKYVRRCRGPYDYCCRFAVAVIASVVVLLAIVLVASWESTWEDKLKTISRERRRLMG